MKVFHGLDEVSGLFKQPIVAVGNFDGVHIGHRAIIEKAVARAEKHRCDTVIVTFEPHPQLVIGRQPSLTILTPLDEKLRLLSAFPIQATLVIPFTLDFAHTEPEAYVEQVYGECFQARELIVGFSHAFGRFGKGNAEMLRALGEKHGFHVHIMPPLKSGEDLVNSSRIRSLLSVGKLAEATELLGHPYTMAGRVVEGAGRGRQLQFPTANLALAHPNLLIPRRGVYAVRAEVDGHWRPGVMNIGVRPTFGAGRESCEVHILDFDRDLYHQELRVELVARIRDEQRFPSVEALQRQIMADVDCTRRILNG